MQQNVAKLENTYLSGQRVLCNSEDAKVRVATTTTRSGLEAAISNLNVALPQLSTEIYASGIWAIYLVCSLTFT